MMQSDARVAPASRRCLGGDCDAARSTWVQMGRMYAYAGGGGRVGLKRLVAKRRVSASGHKARRSRLSQASACVQVDVWRQ